MLPLLQRRQRDIWRSVAFVFMDQRDDWRTAACAYQSQRDALKTSACALKSQLDAASARVHAACDVDMAMARWRMRCPLQAPWPCPPSW